MELCVRNKNGSDLKHQNVTNMNKEKAYKRLLKRQVQRSHSDSAMINCNELANMADIYLKRPLEGPRSADSRRLSLMDIRERPVLSASIHRVHTFDTSNYSGVTTGRVHLDDQFPPIHEKRHHVSLVPPRIQISQNQSGFTDNVCANNRDKANEGPNKFTNGQLFPSAKSIRKLLATETKVSDSSKPKVQFSTDTTMANKNDKFSMLQNPEAEIPLKSSLLYKVSQKRDGVKQVSFTDSYVIRDTGNGKPAEFGNDSTFALTERNLEIHSSIQHPKHKLLKTTEGNVISTRRFDERVLKWVEERNRKYPEKHDDIPEMEEDVRSCTPSKVSNKLSMDISMDIDKSRNHREDVIDSSCYNNEMLKM